MVSLQKHLANNDKLIHATIQKVESHIQRQVEGWFHKILLLKDCDVPFKYKRQKVYQCLKGARVDLIYYTRDQIAGMKFEVMNVVKVARS